MKYSKKELTKMLMDFEKEEGKYIKSESGTYSKKVLNRLFTGFTLFVIAVLYVFLKTGSEPVALVGGVIAFLTVEVWQLARIKIAETKEGDNES